MQKNVNPESESYPQPFIISQAIPEIDQNIHISGKIVEFKNDLKVIGITKKLFDLKAFWDRASDPCFWNQILKQMIFKKTESR